MTELQPVPAATVVLAREQRRNSDIELLFLQRNSKLVFHGGHWVFPGGRIDDEDFASAADGQEYQAARLAAVRETREEAGIELCEERLIHIAHWTTPPRLLRRFSTWFFVYPLLEPVEVKVDNREILDYRWMSPDAALAAAESGQLVLPQPTRVTVEDLRLHTNLEQLVDAVTEGNIRVFPENSRYYNPRDMGAPEADE